jgi:pimeloyl-ACP methyl ester carboxylesterase
MSPNDLNGAKHPLIRTAFVEANGITFEVDQCGDGPKFALLLHGFPESKSSWRHQLPMLAELGYTAWAPNMRGYGRSSRPVGIASYHIDHLIADVAALIGLAKAQSTLLIGHDWGGAIAWIFAIRKTRPLDRLIVMNVPHPACFARELRRPAQLWKSRYAFFFQLPWLPEKWLGAHQADAVRRIFVDMAVDKTRFPREVTDEYRRNAQEPGALTAMINYYRAAFRAGAAMNPQPNIVDISTLVLWGEVDTVLDRATTNGTDHYVTDLTLRYLPGVSHFVQQEAPETVNALITTWLADAHQALEHSSEFLT